MEQHDVSGILQAALFAAQKHASQRRKGVNGEPYVNHLIEVAALVAHASAPPEVITAALLHDTVEDADVTEAELVERFGPVVAGMVMEVTDDKSLPKTERKRLQIVNAPHKTRGAGMIKLADKISNLRALQTSPPAGWSDERKAEYVHWAGEVVAGLVSPNPVLLAEFERVRLQPLPAALTSV